MECDEVSAPRLLLDTHIWLWYAIGDERLGVASRARTQDEIDADGVTVSAMSAWEVLMHWSEGRVRLSKPPEAWVLAALSVPQIAVAPVTSEIAAAAALLPGEAPADPADRMLAATARQDDLVLATRDRELLAYGDAGHVAVMPA